LPFAGLKSLVTFSISLLVCTLIDVEVKDRLTAPVVDRPLASSLPSPSPAVLTPRPLVAFLGTPVWI